jgi:hypothetical protein
MKALDSVKEGMGISQKDQENNISTFASSESDNRDPDIRPKNKFILFLKIKNSISAIIERIKSKRIPNQHRLLNKKRRMVFASVALVVVLISILAIGSILVSRNRNNASNTLAKDDGRIDVLGAKASIDLNKEFAFPLTDEKGNKVSDVKYYVNSAELRDEIVVQGKKASSVKGRTFLILNMKIVNDYDKPIQMNTRDYVRLSINGNENEKLAPDIHNDPVEVQAISTKYTRLGFPINDNDVNLFLFVGELTKDKEKIELKFD